MSVHDGHRDRLRERFKNEGLDNFEDYQVLELLLFYSIPRKDTNPIAHELLEKFDTLAGVLAAPKAELKKVKGIGDATADFLSFINEMYRFSLVNLGTKTVILTTVEKCGRFLVPYFNNRRNETVFLLCLDAKCKVLRCALVGEGSVNSAAIPPRRVVELALAANATSVVLAHNHPSGIALPSDEDVCTTRRIAAALQAVDIQLVDHIVVADDDFVSMVQSGLYRQEEAFVTL